MLLLWYMIAEAMKPGNKGPIKCPLAEDLQGIPIVEQVRLTACCR